MNEVQTLYKKDSKGKIRVWNIWPEDGQVVQETGLVDGKLARQSKACERKNVGRSNETTAHEQAQSEVESRIAKKRDEGYFDTIEEAKASNVLLPMLAKDYKKEQKKINWSGGVFAQPKLDGMRCLAVVKAGKSVTLISRKGKEIENMDHIKNDLLEQCSYDITLDGELYAHGKSFQENMKLIKKYRPGETEQVSYNIYDVVNELGEYATRTVSFDGVVQGNSIRFVETQSINNEAELKEFHTHYLSEGYEGTIVRHGTDGYKIDGRSSSLLKYKDFIDLALPLVDVESSEARPTHGTPVFDWPGAPNNELRAGCKMSHDEREDLLTNKQNYIGQTAEIRFFEYSDTGVPRFPVLVGFRLDK